MLPSDYLGLQLSGSLETQTDAFMGYQDKQVVLVALCVQEHSLRTVATWFLDDESLAFVASHAAIKRCRWVPGHRKMHIFAGRKGTPTRQRLKQGW